MDYKYIEQLLERYWRCETTLQEEDILRAFFAQDTLPASLERYRALFDYQGHEARHTTLSEDFDSHLCQQLGIDDDTTAPVHAHRITWGERLRPLYHAAAAVAVIALLGTGAQHIFNGKSSGEPWDYDAPAYKDSYDNPREAYETLDDGLREMQEVIGIADSTHRDTVGLSTGASTNAVAQ